MKSIMYCTILLWIICVPGCEKDSTALQKALMRAEKAEREVISLQEALNALRDKANDDGLQGQQIKDELRQTQNELLIATNTIAGLESQKNALELELQKANSTSEDLQKQIAERDRDIKELDQLNLDLTKALEQLEKELQSLENVGERVEAGSLELSIENSSG